ncbi:SMC-Scp complex subunit ScpB [Anaerococcus murdochii]|uniref:SMC-Scp complex subunit ScpB n=1 Tax=Anaerococcus murdochii TaxID=411577 RepID=A0ABS7T129_9FIRM|nr:SMC-Scp complex subunit ScpB [Anaerococcus murdochii]MBZ2387494.1 SMC-Scp complex subunit ScpB [Anaerococcus murdochii]
MTDIYLKGLIEEVLYVWAEPISIDEISKILYDYSKVDIKKSLEEMIKEREDLDSGLIIRNFNGLYQFTTRKASDKYFESLLSKSEKKLTNSTLETLSIIAYKQPITRVEIDKIRGVNSQSTIDSLIDKKLITEKGRLDKIGKPIIYGTTAEFLKYFNLNSLKDLPEIRIDNNED